MEPFEVMFPSLMWGVRIRRAILGVSRYLQQKRFFAFCTPFQLPKSFLISTRKNDLRLKLQLMKSLAVHEQEKRLDLDKIFNRVNVTNNQLIENKIIHNEVRLVLKSGKKKTS